MINVIRRRLPQDPAPLRPVSRWSAVAWIGCLLAVMVLPTGCETPGTTRVTRDNATATTVFPLKEGDVIRITFMGAPDLNSTQKVRYDGKIQLPLIGEHMAAGKTPDALQTEIRQLYEKQLQSKEVTVVLDSTAVPIYVSGAVMNPGKIMTDRPLTALDAVMEAGGFAGSRAKVTRVVVIRTEKGRPTTYTLNLKPALNGEKNVPFYLKPNDIVHVPEKSY